jgi:hypothetical protein
MKKIFAILFLLASFCFSQEQDAVKKDAYGTPSKKELYSRARDVLKKSLENKDFERAGEAYAYLQSNVSEGAPLTIFEEYLIDMEMGKYADGIRKYASQRRVLLDSSYTPEKKDNRYFENDVLHKYLYDKFDPFTEAKADSMVNLVDASDVSDELKDLYATMIYGELTIGFTFYNFRSSAFIYRNVRDTTRADQFLKRSHDFVEKNPYTEHTGYLKNSTIPMVETVVARLREFRKDPLKHKYYTGSMAVYGGVWTGTMTGDVTDYLHTEMGSSFNIEGSLQFRRISLNVFWNYGLKALPDSLYWGDENEDEVFGLTVGFTAFDSRFVKVEPFIGFGSYDFMNLYDDANTSVFVLGLNTDIRIFATKPQHYGGFSIAFVARLKYQALFGTLEAGGPDFGGEDIEAGFVAHQFGINLGVVLW